MTHPKALATAIAVCVGIASPVSADPTDDIGFIIQNKIKDAERMDDFVALVEEMTAVVAELDGTVVWEMSVVGDTIYSVERFDNESAFMAHIEAITPFIPRFFEFVVPGQTVPTTDLPPDIRAIMDQFGAAVPDRTFSKH